MAEQHKEPFLMELQRKRQLVAERLAKLDPNKKEYAWEKEQLDDLDKAIKRLRVARLSSDEGEPMETEQFTQLKKLAESHGLKRVMGMLPNSVRFEKPGLSIETTNYQDFTVVRANENGSTQKELPSFAQVAEYLGGL